jgi:hypothetical protein
VDDEEPASGELLGRLTRRHPWRKAKDADDAPLARGTQRGPAAHGMADQNDRDVAVPLPQLLYCPVHVGQWVSIVRVPSAVTEPEPPYGNPS